ncbi:hypothetical protein WM40_22425 [Robbsia andropogonis]|uniref:Uncharacterized protein n=1 Tax=Robbsia andropogonis TaxID=28092 RepID=A0A0F5JUP6_9BURK|nr:hypothetical protein WM40_22425 [Robbsia andropogonis]
MPNETSRAMPVFLGPCTPNVATGDAGIPDAKARGPLYYVQCNSLIQAVRRVPTTAAAASRMSRGQAAGAQTGFRPLASRANRSHRGWGTLRAL